MSVIDLRATVVGGTDGDLIVELDGDVDLDSAPLIDDVVHSALTEGAPRVVIDLSRVTFLDSRGVRVLLIAHRAAERRGSVLVLRSPTKGALDVLMLTGCETVFSIQPA